MPTVKKVSGSVGGIKEIGVEYLKECFRYDKNTGDLYWKTRPKEHFEHTRQWSGFNSRWAGRLAGWIEHNGYRIIRLTTIDKAASMRAHHIVLALHGVELDENLVADHKDGIRSCNKIENLRQCTEQQNQMNKPIYKNNSSKCPGVAKTDAGTWAAFITVDSVKTLLGTHATYEEAVKARLIAERELKGEFCREFNLEDFIPPDESRRKRSIPKKDPHFINADTGLTDAEEAWVNCMGSL